MNTTQVIKAAAGTLDEQMKVILAAQKTGDVKALSNALRVGGMASVIVEKSDMIAKNPEKFEQAAKDSDIKIIPSLMNMDDERAKAEGFLRFKSAHRAASQVRKVETLLAKLSEPLVRKSRKVKGPEVVA